jgi:hypothetical protein
MTTTNRPNPNSPQELSPREADRLVSILASGPLQFRPDVDSALLALGWIQQYDDMPDAVEAIDGAAALFYDPAGCIAAPYCPTAWRTETWRRQRYQAAPLPPIDWSKPLVYDATRPR